jgi:hypothetical protein
MERQFQCPSCGAGNKVTNPGIVMRVCDYCKTAMYWDKDAVLRAGNKSMELPPSNRFRVGASGKLGGKPFRVLGRITYEHDAGRWNEWFIEVQDGSLMWLTEDEGELFLEKPLELKTPLPELSEIAPGCEIKLNDKIGIVEEIGKAKCLGGEGEIPFTVEIGDTYPYVDGAAPDGSFSFGLEYGAEGRPQAFIGRIINLRGEAKSDAKADPEARLGEIIRCVNCGKPYEGKRVDSTKMVVCEACGSGLELDEAEVRLIGQNVGAKPHFTFDLGAPLKFDNVKYEVMGRMLYVENYDGDKYSNHEYVLYHPDSGYLWLNEERGHFLLRDVVHQRVTLPPFPQLKQKVTIGAETFQIFECGLVSLQWVDGAAPWRAAVGESTEYAHLIKPPEFIDHELTGAELEIFKGRYVDKDEMRTAAGTDAKLPEPRGVASCQQYKPYKWIAAGAKISLAFLVLNFILMLAGCAMDRPKLVMTDVIGYDSYSKSHMTEAFEIRKKGTLVVHSSAAVNNSWLGADIALVNAKDEIIDEFGGDASYYEGIEDDEHWTEGSRSFTTRFRIEAPGTYKLLVHATGGSGHNGAAKKEDLTIKVYTGEVFPSYFWIPIGFSAILPLLLAYLRYRFEQRRWSEAKVV